MRVEMYPETIDRAVERAQKKLIAVGYQINRAAKEYCPVDTGRLRASISVNWTKSGMQRAATEGWAGKTGAAVKRQITNVYQAQMEDVNSGADGIGEPTGSEFTVVIGTNVRYAPFIEFGTSLMGNTPFLRAAFEKFRNIFERGTETRMVTTESGSYDIIEKL